MSSRQILKPPALMRDVLRDRALDQKEARCGVANRRERPRRQARRARHEPPGPRPVRRPAAGHVPAGDQHVRAGRLKHGVHARHERRRMAEVGVHDAHDVGRRDAEAGDDRRAQSELAGAMDDVDPIRPGELVGDGAGAVGRIVVDDHQLEREAARRRGVEQGAREIRQPISFVVGRHDHGQVGPRGRRHLSTIIQAVSRF